MTRHRRLTVGQVHRGRRLSLGLLAAVDLERKDNFAVADVGFRPAGPRLTFFADAATRYGDSYEDITLGLGIETLPVRGVILAGKVRDDGHYGLRLEICLGAHLRVGARVHMDDDSEHVATTYVIEDVRFQPPIWRDLIGARRYPQLKLRGPMVHRKYRLLDDRRTLLGTLRTIDRWAADPLVAGIVLDLSGMRIGSEMLWELRQQLEGCRAAGKTLTVYCDRLNMAGFMLASVADEIWMDPHGWLSLRGLCAGRTYYRNMLDKLGVGFDELRFFSHKSAYEVYSRTAMSPAAREQLEDLIADFYEVMASSAIAARGITRQAWEELVNEKGLLLADEAVAAGLVDSVGSFPDAKRAARRVAPRGDLAAAGAVRARVMGDPVWGPLEWGEPDRIALLYAIGPCAMESGIKGPLLAKKIKAAREDRRVKAVVLRADSPGGDVLPSNLVARELRETAEVKPVIVSQGRVAGSGGYQISMYGDSIVSTPLTLTGSIGVIGAHYWNQGIGDRLGLTYDFVKLGEHADLTRGIRLPFVGVIVPERPLTQDERQRVELLIHEYYTDFVTQVAAARGMTMEAVEEVAQGQIYSGIRAREKGLVDEMGGLWESLRIAKAAAGIPPSQPVTLAEGPPLGLINLGFLRRSPFGGLAATLGLGRPDPLVDADGVFPAEGPWHLEPGESCARQLLGAEAFSMLPPAEQLYLELLLRSGGRPLVMMDPISIEEPAEF